MEIEQKIEAIEKNSKKLLNLLGVLARVEVSYSEENQSFVVRIETSEPGILIGYHGATLFSFQLILGIVVSRQIGEWIRIVVNVGDYREKRKEALEKIALTAAQKAKFSGEPVILPFLSAEERRIIHLFLANHPDVVSQSEGEGENRRLIIKPKSETS